MYIYNFEEWTVKLVGDFWRVTGYIPNLFVQRP